MRDALRIVAPQRAIPRLFAALLCAIAVAAANDAPADETQTSTVFYGGQVFTGECAAPYAQAVAIRGGRIVAVGARADVERAAGPAARRVDLKGKFLMPGMIDAHAHPIAGGMTLIQASFPDTGDSVPALAQFVADQMPKKDSRLGDVLVINGIDIGYWSHAAEIDAALSKGRSRNSRSSCSDRTVIRHGPTGPPGYARESRRPTSAACKPGEQRYFGFDAAFNPNGFRGRRRQEQARQKLAAAFAGDHARGGPGGGTLHERSSGSRHGSTPRQAASSAAAFRRAPTIRAICRFTATCAQRGELTAHVVAYPVVQPDLGNQQIDVVEALRAKFKDVPNLTIPGLKVFADGVVEIPSQTAALTKPYLNTGRSVTPAVHPGQDERLGERSLPPRTHRSYSRDRRSGGEGFSRRDSRRPARPIPAPGCRS